MKQQKLLAAILCAAAPLAYAATDALDEIVVTATRIAQPLSQSLAHTTVITAKDIADSGVPDLPALLRDQAGVEITQQGGIGKISALRIRGTESTQSLVLLDGTRIGSATTGATAIDQLMLDQIERIEIVRGNVSSLYGSEAIGGVIQIFTKRGKGEPSFHANAGVGSLNTQRAAAGFGGEVNATRFNLEVSKFKTDGVSAINPAIVPTVNPNKNGYDNLSFSGNLRLAINADHSISASVFNSQGDASFDNAFGLKTDVNTSRSALAKFSLASDNRFAESWQSHLQWSEGQDDSKSYLNDVQGSNFKTKNRQITWQNTLSLSDHNSLLLGLENLDQAVASNTAFTQTSRKVNSLFGGYVGNFGAHLVQANLRQDRHPGFGTADTGLLGYGYAFTEAWRATASYSTAFRAPTFNDLFWPLAFGYQGNPNLRPERSHNLELGLHYTMTDQRIDVAYFDNRVRDMIAINPAWTTMININQARSDGVEMSYQGQFNDTGVKAALTLQNPRDTQTGLALIRRAKAYGNVGVTQKIGAWQVGGEVQYSGTREDIDINTFARTTLDSYNVVNITASYALDKRLNLSLRADNLFNRDYMLAHGYNTLGRTLFVGVNYQQ